MKSGLILVTTLVDAAPELKPLLSEHIQDNDELLPHVFFGDLTRFVQTEVERENFSPVKRILDVLEDAAKSTDPAIRDLLGASFLENLELDARGWQEMLRLAGPAMRIVLAHERQQRQNSN